MLPVPAGADVDLNLSDEQRNKLLALQLLMDRGLDFGEAGPLFELWDRESGWRVDAANPRSSARGIPQAMTSLYPETQSREWLSDPRRQIEWGLNYIEGRYGLPSKALKFHDRKGWY